VETELEVGVDEEEDGNSTSDIVGAFWQVLLNATVSFSLSLSVTSRPHLPLPLAVAALFCCRPPPPPHTCGLLLYRFSFLPEHAQGMAAKGESFYELRQKLKKAVDSEEQNATHPVWQAVASARQVCGCVCVRARL
jgi:hypothetical protein